MARSADRKTQDASANDANGTDREINRKLTDTLMRNAVRSPGSYREDGGAIPVIYSVPASTWRSSIAQLLALPLLALFWLFAVVYARLFDRSRL